MKHNFPVLNLIVMDDLVKSPSIQCSKPTYIYTVQVLHMHMPKVLWIYCRIAYVRSCWTFLSESPSISGSNPFQTMYIYDLKPFPIWRLYYWKLSNRTADKRTHLASTGCFWMRALRIRTPCRFKIRLRFKVIFNLVPLYWNFLNCMAENVLVWCHSFLGALQTWTPCYFENYERTFGLMTFALAWKSQVLKLFKYVMARVSDYHCPGFSTARYSVFETFVSWEQPPCSQVSQNTFQSKYFFNLVVLYWKLLDKRSLSFDRAILWDLRW